MNRLEGRKGDADAPDKRECGEYNFLVWVSPLFPAWLVFRAVCAATGARGGSDEKHHADACQGRNVV